MRDAAALFILLLVATAGPARAVTPEDVRYGPPVTIQWNGVSLVLEQSGFGMTPIVTMPREGAVDTMCPFFSMATPCWKVPSTPEELEMTYQEFQYPLKTAIAILPPTDPGEEPRAEDYEAAARGDLPPFKFPKISERELNASLAQTTYLGLESVAHYFAPISETEGGPYALSVWQHLIERRAPAKICLETLCSVVVDAEVVGLPAIARCGIYSDGRKLGLPDGCELVAYETDGEWWVAVYSGLAPCDGCGAGGDLECTVAIDGPSDVDALAERLVATLLGPPFGLATEGRRTPSSVIIAGEHFRAPSSWKEGYYENAFAHFTISSADGVASLSGVYNLTVSSEPVLDDNEFHGLSQETASEDGESDYDWFQRRVFDLIGQHVLPPLDGSCEQLF